MSTAATLQELVQLSRELGREDRHLAILGEGNTSSDLGDGSFLVKASGTSLSTMSADGLSRVSHAKVDALLDRSDLSEQDIEDGLVACLADPTHKKPSVETFLHSLCLREPGVKWVGHTHTVSVLSILASKLGSKPFLRHVCPDAIVVCGRHVLLIPYINPGLDLAIAIRDGLARFRAEHGKPPKVILMENHGPVALGSSSAEVLNIMLMLDKWARVLLGSFAAGGPNFLSEEDAAKIDQRLDEAYRRKMIEAKA
ncbi:class II aldolase/adducin family protein [Haloferula sp. BvORR071]|uniref:class II aldolase/adducin family protein n=1 Tax=Haloferula sp. BvORR071 TaxID=1396141 RepID=UPI0005569789|nr:class II aldolase/adducin family protein [Haloferula sp. BvORR071]